MSTLSVSLLLIPLQAGKTGFDTEVVACLTPWLEPSTKDWPKFVMLAFFRSHSRILVTAPLSVIATKLNLHDRNFDASKQLFVYCAPRV